jgi:hypothetical protein
MPDNQTHTGDHLSQGPAGTRAVVSDVPERQGVTGHNVRYVLIGGLFGAVVGFAIMLAIFFH